MEITGVEWTSLSEDFGFYTVSLDDVPPFDVKPFRNPTECNPFWAWEDSYIEKFISLLDSKIVTNHFGEKNSKEDLFKDQYFHTLNTGGYRSVRTNSILKNTYVYSIYYKGKIRENRINRNFESEITDVKLL